MMVASTSNTSAHISMNGEKLEEVFSVKYFGAALSKDGTSTDKNCRNSDTLRTCIMPSFLRT
ncbi:hypothetical protein DPMN_165439 [Dreissena polymorpha]|uniref:Uncharacterized protein n=1 Tax=Dreissena polymorpha TaxID=45954 RepID=A0A9D4EXL5_DREPO|nr:hypothetical protein DPMN_165439 [Dreissena polymorpha]